MPTIYKVPSLTALLLVAVLACFAQDAGADRKLYRIYIEQPYGAQPEGFLYQVEEDGLVISGSGNKEDYIYRANQLNYLNVKTPEIKTIKIRKTGSVGKGVMFGTIGGFLVGLSIGLIQGDDPINPNCQFFCDNSPPTGLQKGVAKGVGLGLVGGITGAIIGLAKIKIPINGDQNIFEMNRPKLKKYAYSR